MNAWLKHVFVLTMGLLIYYAVTFVVVYTTIMSDSVRLAIEADGGSPIGQVSTSIGALFPIPAILWFVGVLLSKWIAF